MKKNKNIVLFSIIFLFSIINFIGCSHTPMNKNYLGASPLPADIQEEFKHEKFTGTSSSEILDKTDNYTLMRIKFSPNHSIVDFEHEIVMDFYKSNNKQKCPVILVLPILGGSNYFANSFAQYFANSNLSALIVHRQKKYKSFKDLKKINTNLKQMVFDHKQAMDWIENQPCLDANQIGVFGISMGSIKAALISPLDKRIKVSVMCLTGGNIANIIANSDEKGLVKKRNKYLEENNLGIEELEDNLKKIITCDPINYAEYADAENSLIILGWLDSTVPYQNGIDLWKKMGKPEKITLLAGHYTAILSLPYVKYKANDFFHEKFNRKGDNK